MRLGIRYIDWGQVGAMLAQDDDNNQVEFFKAFVKECMAWGTRHQVDIQLAYINQKLTTEERQILSMIGFDET